MNNTSRSTARCSACRKALTGTVINGRPTAAAHTMCVECARAAGVCMVCRKAVVDAVMCERCSLVGTRDLFRQMCAR